LTKRAFTETIYYFISVIQMISHNHQIVTPLVIGAKVTASQLRACRFLDCIGSSEIYVWIFNYFCTLALR